MQEKYAITADILDEINSRLKYYGEHSELNWIELDDLTTDIESQPLEDYTIMNQILGHTTQNTNEEYDTMGNKKESE